MNCAGRVTTQRGIRELCRNQPHRRVRGPAFVSVATVVAAWSPARRGQSTHSCGCGTSRRDRTVCAMAVPAGPTSRACPNQHRAEGRPTGASATSAATVAGRWRPAICEPSGHRCRSPTSSVVNTACAVPARDAPQQESLATCREDHRSVLLRLCSPDGLSSQPSNQRRTSSQVRLACRSWHVQRLLLTSPAARHSAPSGATPEDRDRSRVS